MSPRTTAYKEQEGHTKYFFKRNTAKLREKENKKSQHPNAAQSAALGRRKENGALVLFPLLLFSLIGPLSGKWKIFHSKLLTDLLVKEDIGLLGPVYPNLGVN